MTFREYLLEKFKGGYIIRITDDVAFIYKVRGELITFVNYFLAWDKKDEYSTHFRHYLEKSKYDTSNILTQNTYQEKVESLKADYHLSIFESSDRQFPNELFTPKSQRT